MRLLDFLLLAPLGGALAGCIHAPNLQIKKLQVDSTDGGQITYTVTLANPKRFSLFSRCRTGAAQGEIEILGTLSADRQPGRVPAGRELVVSQTDRFVRRQLAPGAVEHETVEVSARIDGHERSHLVVELRSSEPAGACAVLHAVEAHRIGYPSDP